MKKLILVITILTMMLSSCSQDETIEVTSREAISFGNTFIENATRAANPVDNRYKNEGFAAPFEVYATITNSAGQTANLFKQEKVEFMNGKWVYDAAHTQYWIPENTYKFTAIVDGNVWEATENTTENVTSLDKITSVITDAVGMPVTIKLHDASKQRDILLADSHTILYNGGNTNPVKFTFSHLLAKARVTVKNTMTTNSGYTYKVKDIFIEKTAKTAEYSMEDRKWKILAADKTYKPSFGHIVAVPTANDNDAKAVSIGYRDEYTGNWERLFVPENNSLRITFALELYRSDVLIEQKNVTVESKKVDFQPGHAYNFLIQLGNPGEPIKFTVNKVVGWENGAF